MCKGAPFRHPSFSRVFANAARIKVESGACCIIFQQVSGAVTARFLKNGVLTSDSNNEKFVLYWCDFLHRRLSTSGSDSIYKVIFFSPRESRDCKVDFSCRLKRVSDQRLAELETLVALSKMSGKLVTVPLGLGKVDPKLM
uniref:Uncharacterized protein n=1 Tax=Photinus pyralis TaxID=7054 RepID=A0A1Y1MC53_PHOPY